LTKIFTVGHSTRSLPDFVDILHAHGIRQLIDVRAIACSRRNPQFNKETLGPALRRLRIGYRHMKALGGFRRPDSRSVLNQWWRNAAFRGFADYMQTVPFEAALGRLVAIALRRPTAIMCAEAVPWRCHRSLIADALAARGFNVQDIYDANKRRTHVLSPAAQVRDGRVTYPAPRVRENTDPRSLAAT
jgi:uncharacterized protein (DUF488 family)